MRARTTTVTTAALTAFALLACGSGPLDVSRSVRSSKKPPPTEHDPSALHGRYTVPPDQALLPLRLRVEGPAADGAAARVREELADLQRAVSDLPPCAVEVQDYRPPSRYGDDWASEAWATLSVDLGGLATALERMERLDQCRGAVLPQTTRYTEPIENTELERSLSLGGPVLVVDAPEAHLPALLARRAEALQAVTAPMAPQLHPEDYRCVPTGQVRVGTRSLAGVVLDLGVDCRVQADTPEPPAEG